MKKRILIFSLVYLPRYIGGAEVAIKETTDLLGDDYDFDMITLRMDSRLPHVEKIGNVTIYRVGFTFAKELQKYLLPLTGFWEALTLVHQHKYDGMWVMMATYHSVAAVLLKLIYPSIPLILTLQEGDPLDYIKRRARPIWPFFKLLFSKANVVQVLSNYLADFAKEMGATCPIIVVPNGVDIKHFSQETKVFPLKKEKGEIFLITTSRLVKKNAVGDIIKSLTHLAPNIKLLILGIGPLEQELRVLTKSLNLESRVNFVGFVPNRELPAYLHQSDIFIRPSLSEGFGVSFVEAMAAGLPVITTPVGGIVDFLVEGKTGLFCEVNNPKSIADQVELLINDEKLYRRIIINAYTMVKEKYTWDIVAAKMKSGIFSIL
ncbi:MAG: glycosyltransferase family 4 protein [Candidatus Pacebacteria bacterium]|jgi:glycosyltransferase involved in cell wall biosynthesis|nr:glycosyltransferase family 4 protein [Candidatus Paceibacterota bacterium]